MRPRENTRPFSPSLTPKKQLGQNFLIDRNILSKITEACALTPTETILEIGPGLGHLTAHLAEKVSRVIAIETDRRFCKELTERFKGSNVEIIQADFLKYDLTNLPLKLKVIGNLPYYISSAIIAKILQERERFSSLFTTVQLEFGRRLVARPDTKDYSAFSCFVQYYAEPKLLFKIKNTSFKPAPKVDSCFMRLHLREKPLYENVDEPLLFHIIHHAFQKRRKTLPNALDGIIKKGQSSAILNSLGISLNARPENLTIKNFVDIAGALKTFPK
ncbi:MAG TPA: 16S rRNA (adenine(1518)-N(6)/adenine(1519)-N(6))-dimethyltransferase RsmA [Candidatus Omnitrophota bacterium]|nr:16S rRNA (adenine(1518)-N(6)/adenine(1519)-N(6))-dimethyltransferase RsmA [Candidatus Omnitrophota bacterium]HPD85287.1 16S rRNA (adenine(1518)-N(6)/adenine(1519)-N(6))-dimethyltransferase RsmA [Candidatus Omnitrophota bacterium]HRZ04212.1 16S rRNA (adenine(1518)-N(6)/adenine(1519)-N(6))-dimethyltransferase RsmA [Candidatus Omnitrophota bacterium]